MSVTSFRSGTPDVLGDAVFELHLALGGCLEEHVARHGARHLAGAEHQVVGDLAAPVGPLRAEACDPAAAPRRPDAHDRAGRPGDAHRVGDGIRQLLHGLIGESRCRLRGHIRLDVSFERAPGEE
jgi:hypothetical protein